MQMEHAKTLHTLLAKHFNQSRHTLECLSQMILGLFVIQTVNLAKLSSVFVTHAKPDSNYKRIQRFMKRFTMRSKEWYLLIKDTFGLPKKVTLCIDRTNWKFGKIHINYLVISIVYKGFSIPLVWRLLPDKKRGNSDAADRIALMTILLEFIMPDDIKAILADREFIDHTWIYYLQEKGISFVIRAKHNILSERQDKSDIAFSKTFENLKVGQSKALRNQRCVLDCQVYVVAKRLKTSELLILVSDIKGAQILEMYKLRWEIECLFSALKQRGFNWEQTHLTHSERLKNLLSVLSIAFIWAYRQGEIILKETPLKPKKHGFPQHSIIRVGIDFIARAMVKITINPKLILESMRNVFDHPKDPGLSEIKSGVL